MHVDAVITSAEIEKATADEWVAWMLRNYARWHYSGEQVGPKVQTHCASVEHRYVPRRGDFGDDDEPLHIDPTTEPVDERAGDLMDRLVLAMPARYREVLRAHYVKWPNWTMLIDRGGAGDLATFDAVRAKRVGVSPTMYLSLLRAVRERLAVDLHNNVMRPLTVERMRA